MKRFKEISFVPPFVKDLKKLQKKYKTIEKDLIIFIDNALFLFHKMNHKNLEIHQITGFQVSTVKIYKAKKFACRSLKGLGAHSGIRIIYAYNEAKDMIEFIEIYYKGDKENEDIDRIRKYLEGITSEK